MAWILQQLDDIHTERSIMIPIDRPMFIVGMPRSGSTAFYRVLSQHPAFATTTHVTRKAPTWYAMLRLLGMLYRTHEPGEAGSMWDRFAGDASDVLEAGDVTPGARKYYEKAVTNVLRLYGKPRFLSKCPRNGLRMGFLSEIFPDARFIHLVRDGRAVCRSIMERRRSAGDVMAWWDAKPRGWRQWEKLEPVVAVAHQWDEVLRQMAAMATQLPAGHYIEARYEDFCADPAAVLEKIMDFCGLSWPREQLLQVTIGVTSRNDKWSKVFTDHEIKTISCVMQEGLTRFGYI